ncbi:hypothetical protein BOO35_07055 [Vibrio navarrensis]|uniref:hypothetical protein n=1 Tax=Vibrio navarrensis TaxID=29495 RepID=UPI001865FE9E|nr:hypothetical protein [Vibrio navarrensis]MBE3664875.1 hypothetical protein [Vibrio navarrensis]MBE4589339.1 hypothetical protein [Vibrio navarrensis]
MKFYLTLLLLLAPLAWGQGEMAHHFPQGAFGVVSVGKMNQGELIWLRGRVGDGRYTHVNKQGQHCTLSVPVAVGQVIDSGLGIEEAAGLSIIVMSDKLNHALLSGERIISDQWQFVFWPRDGAEEIPQVDGYIVQGIEAKESFVLNSKRRWVSWLTGDSRLLRCWRAER